METIEECKAKMVIRMSPARILALGLKDARRFRGGLSIQVGPQGEGVSIILHAPRGMVYIATSVHEVGRIWRSDNT